MDSAAACMDAYRAAAVRDDGLAKGDALRGLEALSLTLAEWQTVRDFCKVQKLPGVLEVTTERFIATARPPQAEPHLCLADCQLARSQHERAGKTIEAYLAAHGHDRRNRWLLALTAFKANRHDIALPLSEQGLADQPAHFGFQATLTKSLWELGRKPQAVAALARLQQLLGERPADWAGYVAIAHRLQQPKQARAALDRMVALIVDGTITLNPGAIYLLQREDMHHACTATLRALDAGRYTSADEMRQLFDSAIAYGATATARALGTRVMALDPDPYTERSLEKLAISERHGLTE